MAGEKRLKFRRSRGDLIYSTVTYIILGFLFLITLYPLYFVVIASFSDPALVNSGQIVFWPQGLDFRGYERIFELDRVWHGYLMSIYYTLFGTLFNLFLTFTIAYVLTRKDFMARNFFMKFLMLTMFFGGGLIPTFILVQDLGLYDTPLTLILFGGVSVYNVIVTKSTLENTIPYEMYEAAAIDGCGQIKFFIRFVLPLSKAIIAVMALFYAVGHWNDFMNALIYTNSEELQPLQLVLRNILIEGEMLANENLDPDLALLRQQQAELMKYGLIVVASVPLLVAYPFIQKFFTQGIMIGSVKG